MKPESEKLVKSYLPEPLGYSEIWSALAWWMGGFFGLLMAPFTLAATLTGEFGSNRWFVLLLVGIGGPVLGGALFGARMASFFAASFEGIAASVKVLDPDRFRERLREAMSQIAVGYYPTSESADFFTYQANTFFARQWTEIFVEVRGDQAYIVGPRNNVNSLVQQLEKKEGEQVIPPA